MNDMKLEHTIGFIIIGLLIIDVLLTSKLVNGKYPWEGTAAA